MAVSSRDSIFRPAGRAGIAPKSGYPAGPPRGAGPRAGFLLPLRAMLAAACLLIAAAALAGTGFAAPGLPQARTAAIPASERWNPQSASAANLNRWIEALKYLIEGAQNYARHLEARRSVRPRNPGERPPDGEGGCFRSVLAGMVAVLLIGLIFLIWRRRRGQWIADLELRSLFDSVPELIAVRNADGRFLLANRAAASALQTTPQKLTGKSVADVLPPEDAEAVLEQDRQALEKGEPVFVPEEKITAPDGTSHWLQTTRIPLHPKNAVLAFSVDIGPQKQQWDRLRESEETLVNTLNAIGDGVLVADYEGRVDWMNEPAERLTGWPLSEARGQSLAEIYRVVDSENGKPVESPLAQVFRLGESIDFGENSVLITREGKQRRIAATGSPIRDGDGKIIGIVLVFRDMTDQFERIELRGFSQKMEAIGQVASGIAHDFNNIFAGIMGYAELLRNKVGDDPECISFADEIRKGAIQAADLNGQLLAFARRGRLQTVTVDVHEVIAAVLEETRANLDPRISIDASLQAHPPTVFGDPRQIRDAVRNLVVNAIEAMPMGGSLSITTEHRELDDEWMRRHPAEAFEMKPGRYLLIAVSDTGIGIEKNIQKRIFEPFFSTKRVGQARGMGLAAVYGIVKNHEGAILVESQPGQGSIFTLFFPTAPLGLRAKLRKASREAGESLPAAPVVPEPAPPPATASTGAEPGKKSKGRILFVDDDIQVRTVGKQFLEQLGYTVECREDGATGVEYYRTHWQDIDLVILDMIMRKMGGRQAFRKMRSINPNAKILLCTGYTMGDDVQTLLDMGAAGVLQKPFSSTELRISVENALAGRGSGRTSVEPKG